MPAATNIIILYINTSSLHDLILNMDDHKNGRLLQNVSTNDTVNISDILNIINNSISQLNSKNSSNTPDLVLSRLENLPNLTNTTTLLNSMYSEILWSNSPLSIRIKDYVTLALIIIAFIY